MVVYDQELTIRLNPGPIKAGWALLRPITLAFVPDAEGYVVTDDVSIVYGDGRTAEEAFDDYISSLISYYQIIAESAASGDSFDQIRLGRFQAYLRSPQ